MPIYLIQSPDMVKSKRLIRAETRAQAVSHAVNLKTKTLSSDELADELSEGLTIELASDNEEKEAA